MTAEKSQGIIKVYRMFSPVYLFFIAAALVLLLAPVVDRARAEGAPDYQSEVIDAARENNLAKARYWEILLHYKQDGQGKKSLIDDPKYFLAPDGKTNPGAELDATLAGLFRREERDDDQVRCRFPARFSWLKERLFLDESRLVPAACAKFNEMYSTVKPKTAALIFPAAHGNGPASMFGHTLVRIDSGFQSDLLSYAVNYAAFTNETNGFVYAFRGIFGFYRGYFSLLPYYEKVTEYNDMEHRDIWEYALGLSEEEVRRMVLHIWELKEVYSDYFFFDENCSFDLLFLLEAARPTLQLTDRFWGRMKFWVIPSDTVRVVKESGLVVKEKYRPSQATRIEAIASSLDSDHQKLALGVIQQKISLQAMAEMPLAPQEKAKILDLTAEFLQYKYSRRQLAKEEYLKAFLPALQARSSLGSPAGSDSVVKPPLPPEQGHQPGKYTVEMGRRTDSSFTEIGWRAAYHDLLDPDAGYIEGAQINFFDVRGRYYFKEESAQLQRMRFIDIVSLSPRDAFFHPISWNVNTGFDRTLLADGKEHLVYRLNPGGGVAYKTDAFGITYALFESDLNVGGVFDDNFSFGLGPSVGLLKNITDDWKINLSAQSMFYALGDKHRAYRGALRQVLTLSTNNTLDLSLSREKTFDHYQSEVKLGWNLYY